MHGWIGGKDRQTDEWNKGYEDRKRNKWMERNTGATTLSITTFNLTTLSITINRCDTQRNNIFVMLSVTNKPFRLNVFVLSVVILNVEAPVKVLRMDLESDWQRDGQTN